MILIFSLQTTSNVKRLIVGLIIAVTLTGCERDMTLTMDGANPPTFKLSGSGRLIFFTVYEPVQGRPSIDDPVMWEIRPTDENLISKLPAITYGVVPLGFRQTIPIAGEAPPQLVAGKVYSAGGPAFDANGGSIRFTIKDGRAIELPDNK
jgi:hypothetical protein